MGCGALGIVTAGGVLSVGGGSGRLKLPKGASFGWRESDPYRLGRELTGQHHYLLLSPDDHGAFTVRAV